MNKEAGTIIQEKKELLCRGLQSVDSLYAVVMYDHAPCVRNMITQLKYYRQKQLADHLALLMHQYIPQKFISSSAAFCPVPLHWTRQFSRGFNQSELLAHFLGVRRNIPVLPLLKRKRSTGHQAWRSRQDRLMAVQNAFAVYSDSLPETVILIDDLSATGSTLESCAQALKESGVQRVEGWVIALA